MDTIVERYLATWNETDDARRAELLRETFAEGATYEDPLMRGAGLEEIDGLIRAVHARFPGFLFRPDAKVEQVGEHLRFSWTLAPAGGAAVAHGTDFARVVEGRLSRVVGFLDPVGDAG